MSEGVAAGPGGRTSGLWALLGLVNTTVVHSQRSPPTQFLLVKMHYR